MIQSVDDLIGLRRRGEVGKRETTEDTVIEVIVECIWERQVHVDHQLNELLLLDCERDILDNNGSRNELFIIVLRVWTTWSRARSEDGLVLLRLRVIVPQLNSCQ